MHYKTGSLEATPDVRSVPLGAKRRKGRPKKIPNCLVKSPISVHHHEDTVDETDEEAVEADDEETVVGDAPTNIVVDVGLRTRKRKKAGQNPPNKRQKVPNEGAVVAADKEADVAADAPTGVVVGLGNQKPPKKRARLAKGVPARTSAPSGPIVPSSCGSSSPTPSGSRINAPAAVPSEYSKPVPRKCKKKLGLCSHQIVLGAHYDKKEWNIYAECVRLAKSATPIDPDYVAQL